MLTIKKVLTACFLVMLLSCGHEKKETFHMPGQFEPQEAVWLGWQGYEPYYPVNIAMIKTLLLHVKVNLVTESDSVLIVCKSHLKANNIDTSNISFYVMPGNEFWMRDHGATYVVNKKGGIKAVDFEWSSYGYKQWLMELYKGDSVRVDSIFNRSRASKRGKIDSVMAATAGIETIPSWISIEGGALEVNGKGTLLLNEDLTTSRNPGVSKENIEKEFKRVLGVTNIIWLQQGLAEDPHIWQTISGKYVGLGTGGHTDEFVKFADANTILMAWVDEEEKNKNPLNQMNFERLSRSYEILKNSKDENGEAFTIIKVPLPDLITQPVRIVEKGNWEDNYNIPVSVFPETDGWKVGDTALRVAASSYLNYYVTNGLVILPSYIKAGGDPKKEELVKELFTKAFPGRKLVFLDAMPLNWEGGGIHCGTQQQPGR